MSPGDRDPRVPLGPIGGYVIENLKQLRDARRLSYRELSDRLEALGRPIPTLGLSRIEKGNRRVDADDLVALALALGVNPTALLLPRTGANTDEIELTADQRASALDAWDWADGRRPLPPADPDARSAEGWYRLADFASYARPVWAPVPEYLSGVSTRMAPPGAPAPVIAGIVTSDRGVLITRRVDQNPPWGFTAGWGEPGESPADTIIREVKEEADLRIEVGEYLGERDHPATGRHMIYYAARPTHGTEIHLGDKGELTEVRWVSLTEADELLPGMFAPVRAYLAREIGEG
jgi:8-oxo-dGTP pyrophosphatase MutT (NUDIX family)/transcriptional regulator with XRE-family HTH domain